MCLETNKTTVAVVFSYFVLLCIHFPLCTANIFGVEKSRVGKFMVEEFMVEKSGVERSGVEAWG